MTDANDVLRIFHQAASRVPAYREILGEANLRPDEIRTLEDFRQRVPLLTKHNTFARFGVADLCWDGRPGAIRSVLTSSGHSGVFSFGLYGPEEAEAAAGAIDDVLDAVWHVRSRPTLLINCLPMGVKVDTRACTLGETSVRPDMVTALVRQFAEHFEQVILVADAVFLKHVLERGETEGIDWRGLRVHGIVGEEPLAENARKYFEGLLGASLDAPQEGTIVSSMGVAELGLNLFAEFPPAGLLVRFRRALHEDAALRLEVTGREDTIAPMIFAYDPRRLFVETLEDGLLALTVLDPSRKIPLVRYVPGDSGRRLELPASLRASLERRGLPYEALADMPLVQIHGRSQLEGASGTITPEHVKEGLYLEPELAGRTTANFRLRQVDGRAQVRVQLAPRVQPDRALDDRFARAIATYVKAPLHVTCEGYETFGSGMSLDYERKLAYMDW